MLDQNPELVQPDTITEAGEGLQQAALQSIPQLFAKLPQLSSARNKAEGHRAPRLSDIPPGDVPEDCVRMRRMEQELYDALVARVPTTEAEVILVVRAHFDFFKHAGNDPALYAVSKVVDEFHRAQLTETLQRPESPWSAAIDHLLSTAGNWSEEQFCEAVRLEQIYADWTDACPYGDDGSDPDVADIIGLKALKPLWALCDAIEDAPMRSRREAEARLRHFVWARKIELCEDDDFQVAVHEIADFLAQCQQTPKPKGSRSAFKKAA